MNVKLLLSVAMLSAALALSTAASADERGHEEHARPAPRAAAPRQAPPKFQAHPPGQHPHGPMVRSHAVRVLAPRVIVRGHGEWRHWDHPEFSRPVYYWDWAAIHSVSCTAEDSYGDQYPVTEAVGPGFGIDGMTGVEDDALDRCYQESGEDASCYLATCSHF